MPDRQQARTVLSLLTRGASFGSNDAIDWGELGAEPTSFPNPFVLTTIHGLRVTVSRPDSGARFARRDQAVVVPTDAWNGNFAPGKPLLTTGGTAGPITLDFGNPIQGGGAQIQPNCFGPFTASIEAYDASGRRLARFTLDGISTDEADDSALFIGIRDGAGRIVRIDLDVAGEQLAIDQFDIAFRR